MLLSSLSILMGAILVPSDYFWVYSTHIILMCLYLIYRKLLIPICLTLLSLISVIFSECSGDGSLNLTVGQEVLVDFSTKELIIKETLLNRIKNTSNARKRISIVYVSTNGTHQTLYDFNLIRTDSNLPKYKQGSSYHLSSGVIRRISLPDKNGSWWQRNLYIKRQIAQFNLQLRTSNLDTTALLDLPIKERLLITLDQAFSSFSSWRFSKALLLGQDDLWSERDTWIVRTLGLAHLFVVSGLHTGFMFVIGCFISRLAWQYCPAKVLLSGFTRWHCDLIVIIPLLFFYAYITSWGEPVVRASIMLSVYLCSRVLGLKFSAYGIVTFSLWLVLLIEPRSILSTGLWLSFGMVYLLIGFCQTSTKLSRLLILQVMLTTASMVMILGWQEAISSTSILINVSLIPLTALLWFPWGVISCFEVLIFDSVYSYALMDSLLTYLFSALEWVAFTMPLLIFETFDSKIPRIIMIFFVAFWVYQSPLNRGWVGVISIWFVLFSSMLVDINSPKLSLLNKEGELFLKNRNEILLSDAWVDNTFEKLVFSNYLEAKPQGSYMLSPEKITELSPNKILQFNVKWVVLKEKAPNNVINMFNALLVDWLIVSPGESLSFYFQGNQIILRHSGCIYSLFLFKSDTCKRVEKLESMLNYTDT